MISDVLFDAVESVKKYEKDDIGNHDSFDKRLIQITKAWMECVAHILARQSETSLPDLLVNYSRNSERGAHSHSVIHILKSLIDGGTSGVIDFSQIPPSDEDDRFMW